MLKISLYFFVRKVYSKASSVAMCKRSYEAVPLGGLSRFRLIAIVSYAPFLSAFSRTSRPAAVVRYRCLLLRGLSGRVMSTSSISMAGLR